MLSLNPQEFVKGGLMNDTDVEVTSARYAIFDYGGSLQGVAASFAVRLELKDLSTGEEHVEYLSAGKSTDFVPNDEDGGKTAISLSGKSAFNRDSNLFLFLQSLADLGVDMKPLSSGDVSMLDGLKFHLIRKPAPKREGLSGQRKNPDREPTYVAASKVIFVPWDKSKSAETEKPAPAKRTAKLQVDTVDQEAESLEQEAIQAVRDCYREGMTVRDLGIAVTKKLVSTPPAKRNRIVSLVVNKNFLSSRCGAIISDGDEVILPEEVPF